MASGKDDEAGRYKFAAPSWGTQRDLDALIELQQLLGDPRQRVEVSHDDPPSADADTHRRLMPASRRYVLS